MNGNTPSAASEPNPSVWVGNEALLQRDEMRRALAQCGARSVRLASLADADRLADGLPEDGCVLMDARTFRMAAAALSGRIPSESGAIPDTASERRLRLLLGDCSDLQRRLLFLLLDRPDQIVSRKDLCRSLFGGSGKRRSYHALHQQVHLLRKRLGGASRCIRTHRLSGFEWSTRQDADGLGIRLRAALVPFVLALVAVLSVAVLAALLRLCSTYDAEPPAGGRTPLSASMDGPIPRPLSSGRLEEATVPGLPGHGADMALDWDDDTWYEGERPARAGDVLTVRISPSVSVRRDNLYGYTGCRIRFGRPGETPAAPPPVHVETTPVSRRREQAAEKEWKALGIDQTIPWPPWMRVGRFDPETGDLLIRCEEAEGQVVSRLRIVVDADCDGPLVVRGIEPVKMPASNDGE